MKIRDIITMVLMLPYFGSNAQQVESILEKRDSLHLKVSKPTEEPIKILHAEPLYIDLIRDLGARKGEKEWNVGFGLTDKRDYDEYEALVEYEWAIIDRLGLEIELPFSLFYPFSNNENAPGSRLNSLKLAGQYTFLVSEKARTSLALGYIHEFEFAEFKGYGKEDLYTGNIYNPFFIAAKRLGSNFHSLIYTGPRFIQHFLGRFWETEWQVNTNFHYMIPESRNFIGIEFNKELRKGDFDMTIRPQMRVGIADNLLIGIVSGIPIKRENERFSTFLRLIYEPGHQKH